MDASPLDPNQVVDPLDPTVDPAVEPDPLPQPPDGYGSPEEPPAREQRPGELTTGWRIVFAIGWIGVILGTAAVWKSSRTLGLPLWWLGPEADPRPLPVQMLPFVLPVLMIIAAVRSTRHLPWFGLATAAAAIGIAIPDLDRYPGLATVEIALALAGALVSGASFAGVLARAE
jgi:hypothetical protein